MNKNHKNFRLTKEGRFEVLGLISIALPGPWWWHTEDLNDPKARGAIFRCHMEGQNLDVGYLLVADVSADPQEPNIAPVNQLDVDQLDRVMEQEVRREIVSDGREMIKWMSSHLNETSAGKALVTAYIARDQGKDRQHIDTRIPVRGRKVILAACFDVDRASELASPIYAAMKGAILFDAENPDPLCETKPKPKKVVMVKSKAKK